jgi:hypothetical protein
MTNWSLIEQATKLAQDFYSTENIYENSKITREKALDWYNHTEITDAEMLAAAVISGHYRAGTAWDELEDLKEFYFPSTPVYETIQKLDKALENDEVERMEGYITANNIGVDECNEAWNDYDYISYHEEYWGD